MAGTKERIADEALRLFSEKGYQAASMRDIAGVLGITQGAIYRHYASKRAILDEITRKMETSDRELSLESGVPSEDRSASPKEYSNVTMEQLRAFALSMFHYWTENETAARFRRLLLSEKDRDCEIQSLWRKYLSNGVLRYLSDIFREMPTPPSDPEMTSLDFWSPLYMLMELYDASDDRKSVLRLAEKHITEFTILKGEEK